MKTIKSAFLLFLALTILTGLIYPLLITIASLKFFPEKAQGSLLTVNNKIVGSSLIGQQFISPKYFWPRPSAIDYDPLPSGGSNLAISSKAMQKAIADRKASFLTNNFTAKEVPAEMLFTSGSGLDPHISLKAAELQVDRIIKARNWSEAEKKKIEGLIYKIAEARDFHVLGEPRVNVLKLNLALDTLVIIEK
ncbi:MAG: potassium-transporting ATPase subunit KdpC [Candidatus Margulisbacteria bacterium]|nr:potassium-transporting ATPase subunit KdpC [Candidatus Margulisiibacteriota bacterium]